jgi:two-component system, LuxR family, sensor kinase FixL
LTFAQRMRVRVGSSVALVLVIQCGLVFAPHSAYVQNWLLVGLDLSTALFAGTALYLYRRDRSPTLPSVLLLSWMLGCMTIAGSAADGLPLALSSWTAVLALLALYLLGPRHGSIFAGLAILQMGWSFFLHVIGAGLPMSGLAPTNAWMSLLTYGAGVVLVAVLGYVYEVAQRRTLGELADALITSEHNERQLDAVVESTTAAICSLDHDLRLLTWNRAFADMAIHDEPAPRAGDALGQLLSGDQLARWQPHLARVLAGAASSTFEEPPPQGQDAPCRETAVHPILAGERVVGVTVFSHDITGRKRAEAEMHRLHQELMHVSRQAGMATVASEVLHNAGNVLNSTGISTAMIERHLHGLRIGHLSKAVGMLKAQAGNLDAFLRDDPRGQRLLELLDGLVAHFEQQHQQLGAEVTSLRSNVEHLTRIIHAQQSHARSFGVHETVTVDALVGTALELQSPSWAALGITVERQLAELPPLHVDRHKVIEIMVNLVGNARHSLRHSGRADPRLRIRTEAVTEAGAGAVDRVRIHVEDNGGGIAPEHQAQLFRLGFTTKQDGSGIGLHSSANAAKQLGGSLSFHSDGPGQGAVFTLELPVAPADPAPTSPGTAPPGTPLR